MKYIVTRTYLVTETAVIEAKTKAQAINGFELAEPETLMGTSKFEAIPVSPSIMAAQTKGAKKPIAVDLAKQVHKMLDQGKSKTEIIRALKVPPSFVDQVKTGKAPKKC